MSYDPAETTRRLAARPFRSFEAGRGVPLVLLHGITANARIWDPVAEPLAERFHVSALDQRGHGASAKPTGAVYSAEDYAQDALDLIAAIDGGPAILVGHSLGARNALAAAALAPAKILAVVAIEFAPFIEASAFDSLEQRVAGGAAPLESAADVRAYLRDRYPLMPADAIERRLDWGYERNTEGRFIARADPSAMMATCHGLRADLIANVEALAVPTLLVRGALSRFVSASAFAATRALRPDLAYAEVAEADHYVPEEQAGATVTLIEDFLASLRLGGEGPTRARALADPVPES